MNNENVPSETENPMHVEEAWEAFSSRFKGVSQLQLLRYRAMFFEGAIALLQLVNAESNATAAQVLSVQVFEELVTFKQREEELRNKKKGSEFDDGEAEVTH